MTLMPRDPMTSTLAAESIRTVVTEDELYRAHVDDVARWVANHAGAGPHVEDLVHDVFVVAFRRLSGFRGDAQPSTWLYVIALNVVRNHRRRQRFRRWLRIEDDDVASTAPGPDEALERRARRALVYRALDDLTEKDRTVLIMFEIDGLSGEAIAEHFDVKVGTVWVWLHRARKRFGDRIRDRVEAL